MATSYPWPGCLDVFLPFRFSYCPVDAYHLTLPQKLSGQGLGINNLFIPKGCQAPFSWGGRQPDAVVRWRKLEVGVAMMKKQILLDDNRNSETSLNLD